MKITALMRPGSNHGDHAERLPDSKDTSFWPDGKTVDTNQIYDVIGSDGVKMGEIPGEQLEYFIRTNDMFNPNMLLNSVREGVVVIDSSGRICYANETYGKIVGVPLWRILGKNMHIIEPDALLLEVLMTGSPMKVPFHVIKSVNIPVTMRMYPIFKNGAVCGAYSIFRDVTEIHKLNQEVERITGVAAEYINQLKSRDMVENLQVVTRDPVYANELKRAVTAAQTDASILVRGENGVGKEVFTRFIHANSQRREKPFVALNCAAIPDTLVESELFGYEEGAFTGAKKNGKIGKFQLAEGGTLFLDEIGDMPFIMQAKLLRVLQTKEIERVGGESGHTVDVRVISATNQPLEQLIREKRFREDLYYRLNVLSFRIPALRERPIDIPLLADFFLQQFNKKYGKKVVISENAYEVLCHYGWPGNVRELQNCIEAAVIMCTDRNLTRDNLIFQFRSAAEKTDGGTASPGQSFGTLHEETERFERDLVRRAVAFYNGNREAAMRHLGISKRTFYRKI